MTTDSPQTTPSRRQTSRLSRQSSSTSLNVGLPPPLPSSASIDMTISSSASSRSLRTPSRKSKSPRKTPRVRRGDVSSSATSESELESDHADTMLLVPASMVKVKASPTIRVHGESGSEDMAEDTTPRRKVAMPIEPMTVGRGKKRETLQERLANAARLKKSQSHGDGFHLVDRDAAPVELSLGAAVAAANKGATPSGKDKVVVCVRIKPTSSPFMQTAYELTPTSLSLADKHPNVLKRGGKLGREAEYSYPVDMLLRHPSRTPDLYTSKVAPLVDKAMNGFNSTIFAYGQTGSGKSFTMTGTASELGIIPCAVDGVFDAITADRDRAFLLRVSYVEIYNEGLRDLLNFQEGKREVPVIHSGKGKVYVSPLVEEIVATPQDVMKLLSRGNEGRKIGATDWNDRSSRSHCVFTIIIESRPRDTALAGSTAVSNGEEAEGEDDVRLSRLNLIDLAGSEKAVSDMERRGEGKHINQSLLALREVINKLTEKKRSHIPYRNSKLTHLLENALGGDSNICVICTMSAEEEHVAETLETLKFAGRCSQVETKAVKNVLPSSEKALIRAKDAEIEELKRRLNGLAGSSGASVSSEKDDQVAELAESVADLEERKKRLTVKLAKLNGEILTSELPRMRRGMDGNSDGMGGLGVMSPAKPKRRRISEFLGHDRPRTPTSHRRAVSGKPAPIPLDTSVQPKDLFSERTTSTLRAALSAKDAEIASLRAALLEAQTSVSSSNTTLLDSAHQLEITRSELASNIEDKQCKIDTLESTILDLRKSREDILIEDQSRLDAVQRKLDMANAELQRAQRVATGDLPSDLEREKEAFKQDLHQIGQSHDVEVARLKGEMGRLREQLKERWSVAETAVAQRKETQSVCAKWEKEVNHAREAVEQYDALQTRTRELEEGAKRHKDTERHVAFLEASNTALQSELARLEAESKDQQPRLAELEALVDELRAERMDALAKVADMEFDLVELKEDVQGKSREAEKAKEELERKTEQLAQRDVEYELARSKLGKEVDGLRAELAQITEQASKDSDRMQSEANSVRKEQEAAQTAVQEALAKAAALEGQIAEHRSAAEAVEKEHAETKRLLELASTASIALEAELAHANDRHASALTDLENARSAAGGNDEMLQRLRDDVELAQAKTKELKEAKVALEAEVGTLREYAASSSALQGELDMTQAAKLRLEQEVALLKTAAGEMDVAVDTLRQEIRAAETSAKEVAGKVDGLQVRAEAAEGEVKRAEEALERERLGVQGKEKEIEALRLSVDGAVSENAGRIATLESELAAERLQLDIKRKELDGANRFRDEAEKAHAERVGQLESSISKVQVQLDDTTKDRDSVRAVNAILESQSKELQAKIDSLQTTTAEDDTRLVQLRTDIDELTRRLEARTFEVNDLTARIEDEQRAKQAALDAEVKAKVAMGELEIRLQQAGQEEGERFKVLQVELRNSEEAVQACKKKIGVLSADLETRVSEKAQVQAKLIEAEAVIDTVRKEKDEISSSCAALQKEIAQLADQAGKGDRAAEIAADKINSLQAQLDTASKAREDAQSRAVAAEAALVTAQQQHQASVTDLAASREKMAALEETIMATEQDDKAARNEYALLKQELAKVQSERDQARTAIAAAEKERSAAVQRYDDLRTSTGSNHTALAQAQSDLSTKSSQLDKAEKRSSDSTKRVTELEKELQQVKDAAAAAAKTTLKRRTSLNGNVRQAPNVQTADLDQSKSAETAVHALQSKYEGEIAHLEAVIDEQEKTINVQREKIVFWSNELEKQQEVIRLLTATPDSPTRSTAGAGTRHIKAHSISDSPSRYLNSKGSGASNGAKEKENANPTPSHAANSGEASKKALTGTFTARNLALPSAPTPLPMHTGQYSNTAARKMRRVTIDHDMEALNESSKIAQARAIFDTPDKAVSRAPVLGNTPKQRRP